jgi:hypothetical protein
MLTSYRLLEFGVFKESSHLSKSFLEDINTYVKKYSVSYLAYRWRKMLLTIRLWFKVNCCSTIMSSDGILHNLISKWWLRPSAVFNRTNIHMAATYLGHKITYIMYNVQNHYVLHYNVVHLVTQLCLFAHKTATFCYWGPCIIYLCVRAIAFASVANTILELYRQCVLFFVFYNWYNDYNYWQLYPISDCTLQYKSMYS